MTINTNPKIAFCVIAKDKADIIERLLDSTKGVFDLYCLADTGSTDETIDVFKKWCFVHDKTFGFSEGSLVDDPQKDNEYRYIIVNNKKVLADFAKARQMSFDLAKHGGADFAFWADTDDIIIGAEGIRSIVQKMIESGYDLGLLDYIYAKSGKNSPSPVIHKRERLISLHVDGHWQGRVHENYVVENVKAVPINDIRVEHERTSFEAMETERRNHQIMTEELNEKGIEQIDDKTLHDLAYDHWEWKEFDKAIEYYQVLLNRQNPQANPEHAFNIMIKIAYAYLGKNDMEQGLLFANRAMHFAPLHPDASVVMAELYANLGQFEEANFYADKILKLGRPQTVAPINELNYTILPLKIKAEYAVRQSNIDEAIRYLKEMYKIMPSEEFRQDIAKLEKEKLAKNAIESIHKMLLYAQNNNKFDNIANLIAAIPKDLRENQNVRALIKEGKADYLRKTSNIKFTGSKSIVFYAGPHFEQWDGNSDMNSGIGGSEGMCIIMARELAKLGNKVYVYNETGPDHEVDGVMYLNHQKWDPSQKCDIFVSLRRPDVFNKVLLAKKQYLWLHDTYYGEVPMINLYSANKVIILSDAHKEIIQRTYGMEDDIFWLSRNAINKRVFPKEMPKRNPYQVIYASSYDRGLDNLLTMWPKIKAAVPEATLKIFYGWNTYDALMNARQSQQMMDYKQKILKMISESDGVMELGRISQVELYKQFAESSIWLYPTEFYEISCINAMTAQAMGCIPVCTPVGALNETVNSKYGFKSDMNRITDETIYLLSNQKELDKRRIKMSEWAKNKFNASKLAKEWDEQFNG